MPAKIITALGFKFDEAFDVKGRLSISDLFPKTKKRCGIYLLNFSDDTFYIGQAIDVVKRFSQHRKKYDSIIRCWFIEVDREKLNEVEEQLIRSAEDQGLLITNKTFVSSVIGETDLDLIIHPNDQENWLENGVDLSNDGFDLYSKIDLKYKIKYQHNFEVLKQNEHYDQMKRVLKKYIEICLPAHKKTELSFWSLSCLPSTNIGTYPRFFCMNINAMEVFVMGYSKKERKLFCFVNLTERFLDDIENVEGELQRYYSIYKTLNISQTNYRAAGKDQVQFGFEDIDEFELFLTQEQPVVDSIKEMNLRLMRKGGTIYSPFHCFNLVKDILE